MHLTFFLFLYICTRLDNQSGIIIRHGGVPPGLARFGDYLPTRGVRFWPNGHKTDPPHLRAALIRSVHVMSRNVRRHSHHRAPRCRWLLPFSKVAPSDRGAVLAVPPGDARALGGSPGGGRGRVRPRCALEGVPAGRARNKGQERYYRSGHQQRSKRWEMVSQLLAGPPWRPMGAIFVTCGASELPPSLPATIASNPDEVRPPGSFRAGAAQRRFAAVCRNTGDMQPSQQRARKEALLTVCSEQQLAST